MNGFVTFHELTLLRCAPPILRPPPWGQLPRYAHDPNVHIFDTRRLGPYEGKWWAVEIRFRRALSSRQVRRLTRSLCTDNGGNIGADGVVIPQWFNSWPGADDDAYLLAVLRRIGVPAAVRAAPFGRDCPGGLACPVVLDAADEDHRCHVGDCYSGPPVFTAEDWIGVDFARAPP